MKLGRRAVEGWWLVSLARTVAAELVRFGAELAAGVIEGANPNPEYIARQLAAKGAKLVGVEVMRSYLTDEAPSTSPAPHPATNTSTTADQRIPRA